MTPGCVYFVGSGPGDPELITVKGRRLIEEANVIVYAGSLVKESCLAYRREGAEVYNSASMALYDIMKVILDAARKGKQVVRLHSGDPSLYGAIKEQTYLLDKEDIPYEVVPGVSSAFASAAALKEELTLPEVSQTVILTRLEGRTPVPEKEKLSKLSKHQATMCIFLSVGMIEKVVLELKEGYEEDTPVAVVYRATWKDEKIIRGSLRDIVLKVKTAKIDRQGMIIVGKTLSASIKHTASRLYDAEFKHGYRDEKD